MAEVKAWLPGDGEEIVNVNTGYRYTIGGKLGAGGFGAVHACTDMQSGLACVAKFAKPQGVVAEVRKRWEDECRLLSAVNSQHIIRLYDFFSYRNVFRMVRWNAQSAATTRPIKSTTDEKSSVFSS